LSAPATRARFEANPDRYSLSTGARANVTRESRGEGEAVTHSRLSGALGALWSLWEQDQNDVHIFANFRNTFKPAAFDFSLAENEGVLAPETSDSYEGGLKVRALNGTVDFEASAFHMNSRSGLADGTRSSDGACNSLVIDVVPLGP
jgi:outer membrane receptor protein involved in Fe transport